MSLIDKRLMISINPEMSCVSNGASARSTVVVGFVNLSCMFLIYRTWIPYNYSGKHDSFVVTDFDNKAF